MSDTFSQSDATRVISALGARAERRAKNGAMLHTTWGTIGAVDTANKFASAYLYGETDGAYMSEGFRIPEATYLTVGQKVKVAINYATGDRWVEEVQVPATTYKKVAIDLSAGYLRFGDGTAALDVNLYRSAANTLKTDDDFIARQVKAGANLTGFIADIPSLGGSTAFASYSTDLGDTQYRYFTDTAGAIRWGSGSATQDISLFRSAVGALKIAATTSGPGKLYVGDIDSGADLSATILAIGIERAWQFEQSGSGANAILQLRPLVGDKAVRIAAQDAGENIEFFMRDGSNASRVTFGQKVVLKAGYTAFPASASADDQFYITDRNEWYIYNGSSWDPGSKNPSSRAYARSRWR